MLTTKGLAMTDLYYCPRCDDCVEPATDDAGRARVRSSRTGYVSRELACGDAIRASRPPASLRERLQALGQTLADIGLTDDA